MIDSDMDMEARKLKYGKDVFKTDAEFRRLQLEVNRLTDEQFELRKWIMERCDGECRGIECSECMNFACPVNMNEKRYNYV